MKFPGKTALITGGTGALGRVVANRLLAEGVRVASSCRDTEEASRSRTLFAGEVLLIPADVTKEEDVAMLFERALAAFPGIDILVNLVGGFLPGAPVRDTAAKDWDMMMNVNLRSAFLCSREFLRRSKPGAYGRIISIGAMPAVRPAAGKGAYGVSKSGVITLTEVLGMELKGSGVTANAIAPSIMDTEANRRSMPGEDFSRWVSAEEIAGLMLFLCSEQGASINGACIPVFGGV